MNAIFIPILAATNELAAATSAAADSGASGSPGFPWTGAGIAAVAVAAAAVVLRKLVKSTPSAEKLDKDELVDDVLEAVAKNAPGREALRAELAAAIAGTAKPASPALAAILRIEESYEKLSSGKYRRRVSVLRSKEGSPAGTLSKIESEVGWEYVPDAVRGEFIRTRQDKVARLVYDAGKAG